MDWNKRYPNQTIISNISRAEHNPEGVGLDLRAESFYKIKKGNALIGQGEERSTPIYEEINLVGEKNNKFVTFHPGEYIIAKTSERVALPEKGIELKSMGGGTRKVLLAAIIFPRSTLFRSGILSVTTKVDPGYWGPVMVPMHNVGKDEARIQQRARVANIVFMEAYDYIARPYEGPWSGGLISTHDFQAHK